jgi:signal transduction histidine kinase
MITHELRNPLNAMAGWLHLLAADPAIRSETSQRAVAGARRAVEQQLAQIEMVGRLLRLAGGSVPPVREPIELGAVLAAEVRRLEPLAAEGGRDIRLRFPRAAPDHTRPGLWIAIEPGLLESALQALIGFALRHGTPGALLEVEVAHDAGDATVTLRIDEGQDGGLSVWNAFGNTGSRLGLDLYLALVAIESYGGTMGPRAAAAGGEELQIRLPIVPAQEKTQPRA